MVDTKRYDPTITRFQKHTKSFISGKTKKGHLNNDEREPGDVVKEEGILVKVDKNNMYGKGWEVKVGNQTLQCSYGDNIVYLPECTLNGSYYLPKKECKVEVSIDKKSKINTITRIKDANKTPISMSNEEISIQVGDDTSLTVANDGAKISGTSLSVDGDVTINTSKDNDLPDKISITELYKKMELIESKLSDNNVI